MQWKNEAFAFPALEDLKVRGEMALDATRQIVDDMKRQAESLRATRRVFVLTIHDSRRQRD